MLGQFHFLALCTVIQQIMRTFNSLWEQDHWNHASSDNPNLNLETVWCSCSWWGCQHLGSLLWTWCFVSKSYTSLCSIEPYAFFRSSHNTDRFLSFSLASQMSWVSTPVCSRQSGIRGMSPFWSNVSMKLFCERKVQSQLETELKRDSAITHYREMEHRTGLSAWSFPPKSKHLLKLSTVKLLLQMTRRIFHRHRNSLGQFRKKMYGFSLLCGLTWVFSVVLC